MQSMTIDSDLSQVTRLAEWLQQILAENDTGARLACQIELLMVEAVNNVIEHGYEGASGNEVTLSIQLQTSQIRLIIVDRGHPPPPSQICQSASLPDATTLPESGWGLGLINAIADQIQIESKDGINTTLLVKQMSNSDSKLMANSV